MDATLNALANLFVEAIPTVVFFILLTVFLKQTYFVPMAKILEERRRSTEGVRELAQKAFDAAEGKSAEFERALQEAKNQMYSQHEAQRAEWEAEQRAALAEARAQADRQLASAKQEVAGEVQAAERELNAQLESLSEQIAAAVLRGKAA